MKLLSLDLSTTCTGWAFFDKDILTNYDKITPSLKGLKSLGYPEGQLEKMRHLAALVIDLIARLSPDIIVIEEINRSKNRLGQKVLDGFHFILLDRMKQEDLRKVYYIDSDADKGWRTFLNLVLTEEDKQLNKQRKLLNKRMPKGARGKLPIINKKHLACRYVNKTFDLQFDVDKNKKEGDIVDAIAMGKAVLLKRKNG